MTVLWGKRREDVQYGSRAYWRTRIPIDPGVSKVTVNRSTFDVGDLICIAPGTDREWVCNVRGMEGNVLGVAER